MHAPFLVSLIDSVRARPCEVDQRREMVVAMREDDAFDLTCSGRQSVTDHRREGAIERAVAFLQPVSVEPVEARPLKRLRRALETFVGGPDAHIWRRAAVRSTTSVPRQCGGAARFLAPCGRPLGARIGGEKRHAQDGSRDQRERQDVGSPVSAGTARKGGCQRTIGAHPATKPMPSSATASTMPCPSTSRKTAQRSASRSPCGCRSLSSAG